MYRSQEALIVENKEPGEQDTGSDRRLCNALSKVANVRKINYQDDELEEKLKNLYGFVVQSHVPVTYEYETAETVERMTSIQKVIAARRLVFAICLGLQSSGVFFGARLRKGEEPERNREITVTVLRHSRILEGLGSSFRAKTDHEGSLELADSGLLWDATSDDCDVQAASHPYLPWDGVQFHPQDSEPEVCDTIFRNVEEKAAAWNLAVGLNR